MKTTLTLWERLKLLRLYHDLLAAWEEVKRIYNDEPLKKKKPPPGREK